MPKQTGISHKHSEVKKYQSQNSQYWQSLTFPLLPSQSQIADSNFAYIFSKVVTKKLEIYLTLAEYPVLLVDSMTEDICNKSLLIN